MLKEDVKVGVRIMGIKSSSAAFGECGIISGLGSYDNFRVEWDRPFNSEGKYIRCWRDQDEVGDFQLATPEEEARMLDMKQREEFAMRYL